MTKKEFILKTLRSYSMHIQGLDSLIKDVENDLIDEENIENLYKYLEQQIKDFTSQKENNKIKESISKITQKENEQRENEIKKAEDQIKNI